MYAIGILLGALEVSSGMVVSSGACVDRQHAHSRSAPLLMAWLPSLPDCPLLGGAPPPPPPPPPPGSAAPASAPPVRELLDQLERSAQQTVGLQAPFVCAAAEAATDLLLRSACDELGSLKVTVEAQSTSQVLLGGEVGLAGVSATGVSIGGLRAASIALSTRHLRLPVPDLLSTPPRLLPNLAEAARAGFSVRFSRDDLAGSPVLFGALQELLRELLRSGASAAIGQALPQGWGDVRLRRIESLDGGRLTLVADGAVENADGTRTELEGLRVRSLVKVNKIERLLVLDMPELLSTFEGFGAKLEVGLPFLRGAAIPLPELLELSSFEVDDGAIVATGSLTLPPLDYDDLASTINELQNAAARQSAPQTITVPARGEEEEPPPPALPRRL